MKRLFALMAGFVLTGGMMLGCGGGGSGTQNTGPSVDNRSAQEKESEALLQRALQKAQRTRR